MATAQTIGRIECAGTRFFIVEVLWQRKYLGSWKRK